MDSSNEHATGTNVAKSSLGRLFVTPLIIVCVVVFCVVVVVLSFGAITNAKQRPLTELLAILEGPSPAGTDGPIMLPQEKELWQAAQELALRLEDPQNELTEEEQLEIRRRLTSLVQQELPKFEGMREKSRQRLFFLMRAAARSGAAEAIPVFVECLHNDHEAIRREALVGLAELGQYPEAREALPQVVALLRDPSPVVRMVACASIVSLAQDIDDATTNTIVSAFRDSESIEVRWNIALTLARLGKYGYPDVAVMLQDMLKRGYWEKQRIVPAAAEPGTAPRKLSATQVNDFLIVSIDATSDLDDAEIQTSIKRLESDPVLAVASRAITASADAEPSDR